MLPPQPRHRWSKQLLKIKNCDSEYQVGGYYVGVPAILGAGGVEKIIELALDEHEQAEFQKSVEAVKKLVKTMEALLA